MVNKSMMSSTQPFSNDDMTFLGTDEMGYTTIRLSQKAFDLVFDILIPSLKARAYAAEVKRIERAAPALEKLMQDERELKNKLLAELREPNAARLAAIKAGPPNWQ